MARISALINSQQKYFTQHQQQYMGNQEYGLKNNQKSGTSITILVIAKMVITVSGIHVGSSYYFIYWRTRSDPPVVILFARCCFLLVGPKYGWA
jgi:hypothetical protein